MGLLMGLQNGVTFFMKWGYKSRFLTPFPDIENALNSEDKPQKRRIEGRKLPYIFRIVIRLKYCYST